MKSLLSRLQLGLRPRFLLAVFLAVMPALGLILFNAAEGRRVAAEQSERSAVQWSSVIANYQRDLERQARTLVAVLARDPVLLTADPAGCNERLGDLLFNAVKEPDNFFNFVAADLNGDIYCSARQGSAGNMHIRDRVYFHKVLETRSVYVDDYIYGKIIKAPIIPVAGPIFDARGELRGVMLVTINLAWIAKTMAPRLPAGAVLRIYDTQGTVLVQSPSHEEAVGQRGSDFEKVRACGANGVFTGMESDGTERLYACSLIPYGEHAFHVAIGVPRDQAYAEADRVLQRSLALFLLVTVGVMIGAWVFGSTLIVKDVQRLMAAAREMALGHLGTRVQARRTDEIGQLERAFNDMAVALETSAKEALAHEAALDAEVTNRRALQGKLLSSLQQLEEKEKAKTRFLAAAGHDLRQPVAAAGLFLEALKLSAPNPRQSELIDKLDQTVGIFTNQLERLLDISKFDAGLITPVLSTFNLAEVFSGLMQNFTPTARQQKLHLHLFLPARQTLRVRSDLHLLRSVLMNLVSNALKFTPEGGILVSARQRGDQVLIQVWDSGIGISPDELPFIFDEFYQVGNPQRNRHAGLGLGLSICQRTMAVLGGEVSCRSTLGRGSVFSFRLALTAEPHETLAPVTDSAVPAAGNGLWLRGKRVVVVEDDALVADGLRSLLQALGVRVQYFPNAEEALAHEACAAADFYISDYSLGGQRNGLEFLQAVQQTRPQRVRAVVITGETSTEFMQRVASSPWPVLHKPVNFDKLVASLLAQDA